MDVHGHRLLAALDAEGILLQHDKVLPSATAVVAGEPVTGSWWAHPMAHEIYRALNDLEDDHLALRCQLVAGKQTLVARRLWPDLLALVTERAAWQTDRLTPPARRLLAAVDERTQPLLLDASNRDAGKRLEAALLVHAVEVHLPSGRHTKGLVPWPVAQRDLAVEPAGDVVGARAAVEEIVARWPIAKRVLPWPSPEGPRLP